jgi:hypothetical protein
MFAIFEDLCERDDDEKKTTSSQGKMLAFFKTLDETLGSGIGWSLSPTSV